MIDTSENLIIIKGQIKTTEIESCQNNNGNYSIIFRNSSNIYSYKEEHVIWLTHPGKPDPANYQIISKGKSYQTLRQYLFLKTVQIVIGIFVFKMEKSMTIREKIYKLQNHTWRKLVRKIYSNT